MLKLIWKEIAKDPGGLYLQGLWIRYYLTISISKDSIQQAQQDLQERIENHPRTNHISMWHSYRSEIKEEKVEVYKLFPGSPNKQPKLIYQIEKMELVKEVRHA